MSTHTISPTRPAGTPEHGSDAGGEFVRGERLADVVVHPGFEALDHVLFLALGGEHNNREAGDARGLAVTDLLDELDTAEPGHKLVGYEQVGGRL